MEHFGIYKEKFASDLDEFVSRFEDDIYRLSGERVTIRFLDNGNRPQRYPKFVVYIHNCMTPEDQFRFMHTRRVRWVM